MPVKAAPLTALLGTLFWATLAQPGQAQTGSPGLRDLSDHKVGAAQLRSAVASRTLTWLTGTSTNNDYMSIGRAANFFGFVALRVSSGHSLTRAHVARDTLGVLDPSQIDGLVALSRDQTGAHQATRAARLPMNRALEGLRVGDLIDQAGFLALGRAYGAAEAQLGQVMAQGFGKIAMTLTPDQRNTLAQIRAGHVAGAPVALPRAGAPLRRADVDRQDLVNLAARFLSWTTGSPALNDFEVVGKPSQHFGFVSLRQASGHAVRRGAVAKQVLDLLSPAQHQALEAAVEQNLNTFEGFLAARAALMRALEVALEGQVIDGARVQRLGAALGETEAQMTWAQAQAMLAVRDTLSEAQLAQILALRATYTVSGETTETQDPLDLGRRVFARCVLCHAPTRAQAVAPALAGVMGRAIAADGAFQEYSPALRSFAQTQRVWSAGLLDRFLQDPRKLVPGTTMGFDGLSSAPERAALIAYLGSLK